MHKSSLWPSNIKTASSFTNLEIKVRFIYHLCPESSPRSQKSYEGTYVVHERMRSLWRQKSPPTYRDCSHRWSGGNSGNRTLNCGKGTMILVVVVELLVPGCFAPTTVSHVTSWYTVTEIWFEVIHQRPWWHRFHIYHRHGGKYGWKSFDWWCNFDTGLLASFKNSCFQKINTNFHR